MLLKAITFFLIAMVALALFGRFRFGGKRGVPPPLSAARCRSCGKPLIGGTPCDCGGKA